MSPEEVRLLRDLMDRFAAAPSSPRDPEAEALVNSAVRARPDTPSMMARYIVVLENTLLHAHRRVTRLEAAAAKPLGGGGFLGAIFGSGRHADGAAPSSGRGNDRGGREGDPSSGGAFLAGAAAVALGVAGGGLIADSIADFEGAMAATTDGGGDDDGADSANRSGGHRGGDGDDGGYDGGGYDGGGDSGGGDSGGGDGE